MAGTTPDLRRPWLGAAFVCVWKGGGQKVGWPLVATMCRSRPRLHATIYFYGPLSRRQGPRFCLRVSEMAPHRGPLVQAGERWFKKGVFPVASLLPLGTLGQRLGHPFGDNGCSIHPWGAVWHQAGPPNGARWPFWAVLGQGVPQGLVHNFQPEHLQNQKSSNQLFFDTVTTPAMINHHICSMFQASFF